MTGRFSGRFADFDLVDELVGGLGQVPYKIKPLACRVIVLPSRGGVVLREWVSTT